LSKAALIGALVNPNCSDIDLQLKQLPGRKAPPGRNPEEALQFNFRYSPLPGQVGAELPQFG